MNRTDKASEHIEKPVWWSNVLPASTTAGDALLPQDDLWNITIVDQDAFYAEIARFGTGAAIIGLVNLISSYLFVTCLNYAAESQVFRIRTMFLRSVLRQDIGWYDTTPTGSFASRMADDLTKLQVNPV